MELRLDLLSSVMACAPKWNEIIGPNRIKLLPLSKNNYSLLISTHFNNNKSKIDIENKIIF